MSLFALEATCLIAIAIAMLGMWVASLQLKDMSIVDIFWGVGFILIATIGALFADGWEVRRNLVWALTFVWGSRLANHIHQRNSGKGEDPRYQAMRKSWGDAVPLKSLINVFALQGGLLFLVAQPIMVSQWAVRPFEIQTADIIGSIVWFAGFTLELTADWQLERFKADPANQGKVMDRGVWRFSRHPNYFGDALAWWGIGIIALSVDGRWWALIGPIAMTVLLVRVSGVPLLEKRMKRTRPGYEDYVKRTSAFVPWFPKSAPAKATARPAKRTPAKPKASTRPKAPPKPRPPRAPAAEPVAPVEPDAAADAAPEPEEPQPLDLSEDEMVSILEEIPERGRPAAGDDGPS